MGTSSVAVIRDDCAGCRRMSRLWSQHAAFAPLDDDVMFFALIFGPRA